MALQEKIKRWGGKGAWALMDQAFFATSNFLVSILLANLLPAAEYGVYSVVFVIFLFVGALHCGCLSNPMMVLSAGKFKENCSAYLGGVLYAHWLLTAAASLCLLLAGGITWLCGAKLFGVTILALGLSVPLILFQWLMRHAAYAMLRPQLAAAAGAIQLVTITILLFIGYKLNILNPATAMGMLGMTSVVSAFWLSRMLKIDRSHQTRVKYMKETIQSHKELGSWGSGVVVLHWFTGEIFLLLSPFFGGMQATAVLRALLNLIMPISRIFTAFGTLAVVALGRAKAAGQFDKALKVAFAAGAIIGVACWLFLGLFHQQILALLYPNKEIYQQQSGTLIWIIGLLAIVGGAKAVLEPALWALEKPKSLFLSYVCSAVFIATVGVFLMAKFETMGVAISMVLGGVVAGLAMVHYLIRDKARAERQEKDQLDSIDKGGEVLAS